MLDKMVTFREEEEEEEEVEEEEVEEKTDLRRGALQRRI